MIRVSGVAAVCERNARVLRRSLWTTLMAHLGEPIFYFVVFGYGFGKYISVIDGIPFTQWLLPGLAISSAAISAGYECSYSAFTRMDRQKTYLAVASTPVSIEEVVLGEALWGAVIGTGSAAFTLLAGPLLGVWLSPVQLLVCLVMAFFTGLTISSLSLLYTSRARGYEDFAPFFTIGLTPLVVISGAYFPTSAFPPAVAFVSLLLPVTHGVMAARAPEHMMTSIAVLLVYTLPLIALAVRGISRRVIS